MVVAGADVVGDGVVEFGLEAVLAAPLDPDDLGLPGSEEGGAVGADGAPFLGPDDVELEVVAVDRAVFPEGCRVEEAHEPHESVGLALVRGGGEEEEVPCRPGEGAAEGVAGDLPVGAGEFVGLVDDDEVPSGLCDGVEPVLVVLM